MPFILSLNHPDVDLVVQSEPTAEPLHKKLLAAVGGFTGYGSGREGVRAFKVKYLIEVESGNDRWKVDQATLTEVERTAAPPILRTSPAAAPHTG